MYKYQVDAPKGSWACSGVPLNHEDAIGYFAREKRVEDNYPAFLSERGIEWSGFKRPVQIFVLSNYQEIRDASVFGNGTDKVVARYYPQESKIFISKAALGSCNSDLIHELIHHANSDLEMLDDKMDEELAYKFERLYRYCHE